MLFTEPIRVILIVGSMGTIVFMLQSIRHSKVQIKDSIFWLVLGGTLLFISIFPQTVSWAAYALGFQAPINVVYLLIIFVLLIQLFVSSLRISRLDARLQQLAQRQALYEKELAETTGEGHNSL